MTTVAILCTTLLALSTITIWANEDDSRRGQDLGRRINNAEMKIEKPAEVFKNVVILSRRQTQLEMHDIVV